jgi:hypothetical protein
VLKCNFSPRVFSSKTLCVPSRIAHVLWPSPFPQASPSDSITTPIASYRARQRTSSCLLPLAHSVPSIFPGLKFPRELADALRVCFTQNTGIASTSEHLRLAFQGNTIVRRGRTRTSLRWRTFGLPVILSEANVWSSAQGSSKLSTLT